jgi:hypothetical protein
MILNVTSAERDAYEAALTATEIEARLDVTIRDRDEKPIGSLTADTNWERANYRGVPGVYDGQVDADWEADVTHQAKLTVSDPALRLDFNQDSPAAGALFVDKMVSIEHLLWVPDFARWQPCGIFWGPITRFRHAGYRVEIEAMGKEMLALDPHVLWRTIPLQRGMLVTEAIKRLMRAMGERRFDFPHIRRKLHKNMTVGKREEVWKVCTRLANSIDCMLFYDGAGRLRLRRHPEDPAFEFHDGEDGTLLEHPALTYDIDRVRNIVEVLGAKPEKGIRRIRAEARAHPSHPLSPEKLARNGEPRKMVQTIENNLAPRTRTVSVVVMRKGKKKKIEKEVAIWESAVRNRKRAKQIAERQLNNLLRAFVDAEYSVLVHPHTELLDVARVRSSTAGTFSHRLKAYSLPLRAGPGQPIGLTRQIRYKPKGKHRTRVTGGQTTGPGPRYVKGRKR